MDVPWVMDKIPAKLFNGMCELLEAIEYADDTSCDKWEFAVTLRGLQSLGCNEAGLRWLIRKGIALHAHEIATGMAKGRKFCGLGDSIFSCNSCFVLSDEGIEYVRTALGRLPETQTKTQWISKENASSTKLDSGQSEVCLGANVSGEKTNRGEANGSQAPLGNNGSKVEDGSFNYLPSWIHCDRTLRLNQQIVKRFKWRAANQEAILSAFEEEGWPRRIDDPLSPLEDQDPKRRLSDTIKGLNKKQVNPLIRFRGDGTGEGVIWEASRNDLPVTTES